MFETILEKTEISSIEEMFGVIRLKWFYQPMAFGWFLYPMSDLGPLLDFYIAGIKKEDNYFLFIAGRVQAWMPCSNAWYRFSSFGCFLQLQTGNLVRSL